jgi:hypothetical protein
MFLQALCGEISPGDRAAFPPTLVFPPGLFIREFIQPHV